MSNQRRYVNLTTSEYARAHKISTRAARRRVQSMPGVHKGPNGRWVIPTLYVDAQRMGIKRKRIYRTSNVASLGSISKRATVPTETLRKDTFTRWREVLQDHPRYNMINVWDRFQFASREQLLELSAKMDRQPSVTALGYDNFDQWLSESRTEKDWWEYEILAEMNDSVWQVETDDDDESLLFYH